VHHKMSKKIAQLTKVIFHLHSKNEENVHYQNSLTGAYEREIETILREANTIVNKQKDALEKQKEASNVKAMVKEMEERHTQERKETQKQFEEYKGKIKDRESGVEKEYQMKVSDMRLEVMDAKKRFEQRIEDFKKQLLEYRSNNDVIDELKKAHQKELGNHIQEHNRKYNELLKDKLNMEDQLKAQYEAEKAALIKEWEKKLKEAVERARKEEQERARMELDKVRSTHES